MYALIVGNGSIGKRHRDNLSQLGVVSSVYDTNPSLSGFSSYEKALSSRVNMVFICTPPSTHVDLALQAVKKGKHVFIEKPLSNNFDGIKELMKTVEEKHVIAMVGYQLRFNEEIDMIRGLLQDNQIGRVMSIRANFGQYLPDWRPRTDYTKNYSASSKLGGGIILDASHEIDYIIWLLGKIKEVFCNADILSDLDIDVEDTADILLKFKKGYFGNVHIDFTRMGYSRGCEIVGTKGNMFWDNCRHAVTIQCKHINYTRQFLEDKNDAYLCEIKHFLDCVKNKVKPISNLDTATETLGVLLALKESAKTGRQVTPLIL